MPTCSAYGCSNTTSKPWCKGRKVSFHRFPMKDIELLKKWLINIRRKHFYPSMHAVLCSEHFLEDDFQYQKFTNLRMIKKEAIPTVFCFNTAGKAKRAKKEFGASTSDWDEKSTASHSEAESMASHSEAESTASHSDAESVSSHSDAESASRHSDADYMPSHREVKSMRSQQEVKSTRSFREAKSTPKYQDTACQTDKNAFTLLVERNVELEKEVANLNEKLKQSGYLRVICADKSNKS